MNKGSYAILAIAVLGIGLAWTSTLAPVRKTDTPREAQPVDPHSVDWSQPFDWSLAPALERPQQEAAAKALLALKDAAKKVDTQRQKSLCRQLARFGEGLFPVLIHEWRETNVMFRAGLIETARQIRGEYAVRFINELFKHPHERSVGDAVNALGDFDDGWGASLLCHLLPRQQDPEIKALIRSNLLRCARSEDLPCLELLRRSADPVDKADIQSLIEQIAVRAKQQNILEDIQALPNNRPDSVNRLKTLWHEHGDSTVHIAILNKLFDMPATTAAPWIMELAQTTSVDLSYDFRVIARQLSLSETHFNTLEQLCFTLDADAVLHLLEMLNNNGKTMHLPILDRLALEHADNRVRTTALSVSAAIQKRTK